MNVGPMRQYRVLDIASSGMSAERKRLEVAAANIANANTLRTPEGGPYRRREVVFETVLDEQSKQDEMPLVQVAGVEQDASELRRVHMPGHPEADAEGYVAMPNVDIMFEMVDLMSAMRSYEANLRSVRAFKSMVEAALQIGRPS